MDYSVFDTLAVAIASAVLGSMLFFAAVVAPTVFRALTAEQAGSFLRALFPNYYLVLGGMSLGAAAVAAYSNSASSALVLAACALIFLFGRYVAVPVINGYRDEMLAGNEASGKKFEAWHRGTAAANFGQMAGLVYVIAQLG
ncbi:MAG: DUF4149 domain-containing protein [Pseudomonadota bacterium]